MNTTATEARAQLVENMRGMSEAIAERIENDQNAMTTLRKVVELEHELEKAKRALVEQLRAEGWTWIRIGEALGVSKQAAAKKYQL